MPLDSCRNGGSVPKVSVGIGSRGWQQAVRGTGPYTNFWDTTPSTASAAEGPYFMGEMDSCLEMPGMWNMTIATHVRVNALIYRAWVAY